MNRLRELREERGLSQREFAKLFSVSQGAVSGWETGRYDIGTEDLSRLAEYFGVSIDYLLCKTEVRNNATIVDLDTCSVERALDLLARMNEEQRKTAIAILKALAEQNNK